MTTLTAPLAQRVRAALRTGPRRPEPFPDSGKDVQLATCPVCRTKGLLLFNAPYERGYPTTCVNCRAPMAVKPKEATFHELQLAGGFTPTPAGMRPRRVDAPVGPGLPFISQFDATQHWEHLRVKAEYGSRRAQRRGLLPRVKDEKVRPLKRVT